jgi:hypothetical protein
MMKLCGCVPVHHVQGPGFRTQHHNNNNISFFSEVWVASFLKVRNPQQSCRLCFRRMGTQHAVRAERTVLLNRDGNKAEGPRRKGAAGLGCNFLNSLNHKQAVGAEGAIRSKAELPVPVLGMSWALSGNRYVGPSPQLLCAKASGPVVPGGRERAASQG